MKMQMAVVLAAFLVSGPLEATSLSSLISSADAIVVGTETAPIEVGNTVSFYLTVERTFAGAIPVGANINVTWNAANGLRGASTSYRGIWFLKKSANGDWDCLPAGTVGKVTFFPDLSLPVSQGPLPAQLAYDPNATALADQITLEAAGGVPHGNPRVLLEVLSPPFSQAALQAFRYLSSSTSSSQMLLGITALVEAGDTNGLLSAEKLSGGLAAGNPGADMVASAIKVQFRNPDPLAVAALGRMATSNEASALMQDAAAQALTAIHSKAAVPWLGILLTESSAQMQIYGAQGLSYFVNGVGIPTVQSMRTLDHLNNRQPTQYRTAETDQHIGYASGQASSFVQYWQAWWAQHPELR